MCSVLLLCWTLFFFKFYFIFKLYIIVLFLPNIKMNPPQVYEPMDSSRLGSSIHGIILPGILEWVAITSSRGFS